eukprot:362573-Chlamydomonas_euryale.AAC.3
MMRGRDGIQVDQSPAEYHAVPCFSCGGKQMEVRPESSPLPGSDHVKDLVKDHVKDHVKDGQVELWCLACTPQYMPCWPLAARESPHS